MPSPRRGSVVDMNETVVLRGVPWIIFWLGATIVGYCDGSVVNDAEVEFVVLTATGKSSTPTTDTAKCTVHRHGGTWYFWPTFAVTQPRDLAVNEVKNTSMVAPKLHYQEYKRPSG